MGEVRCLKKELLGDIKDFNGYSFAVFEMQRLGK